MDTGITATEVSKLETKANKFGVWIILAMDCVREVSLLATEQTNEWILINDNTQSHFDKIFGTYIEYVQEATKEPQCQIDWMVLLLQVLSEGLNGFLTQKFL